MAGSDQKEREALRQAAEAAKALLPKLEQERGRLDARIAAMRQVIEAHELTVGRRGRPSPDSGLPHDDVGKPKERPRRARRGSVARRVAEVLQDGEPRDLPSIMEQIEQRFQESYSSTSVRSVLNRNRDKLYRVDSGRWRVIASSVRGA